MRRKREEVGYVGRMVVRPSATAAAARATGQVLRHDPAGRDLVRPCRPGRRTERHLRVRDQSFVQRCLDLRPADGVPPLRRTTHP